MKVRGTIPAENASSLEQYTDWIYFFLSVKILEYFKLERNIDHSRILGSTKNSLTAVHFKNNLIRLRTIMNCYSIGAL